MMKAKREMKTFSPITYMPSRDLCYMILAGICLGYLCTFCLIAKPKQIYCYLQRIGIGLSPAMSYSALVTKTNRIARILAGSKKKICTKKPRFMSACAQLVIAFILICIPHKINHTNPYSKNVHFPSVKGKFRHQNTLVQVPILTLGNSVALRKVPDLSVSH